MRSFPSASRPLSARPSRAWLAAVLIASIAMYGATAPDARADEEDKLRQEQRQVQNDIDHAEHELEHASKEVARATHRLEKAQAELHAARAALVRVRKQLDRARALAERLKKELAAAERRLDQAAEELRLAREEVAEQTRAVKDTVLGMATDGNPALELVSSYLDSGSVEEILVNEVAGDMVVGREHQALEALEAAEEALQDRKEEIEAARDLVERKKVQAQENLQRVKTLVAQARDTKARVDVLVTKSKRARQAALRARANDRDALRRLEEREARIRDELSQLNGGGNFQGDANGFLHAPVAGPVTSPFGYRTHPIYGYWGLHDGTDFGAACGAQLWAGAAGTVVNTYFDEVYGNRLYLYVGRVNGNNITLVYNHLSSYNVGEGARVGRGDVVGYVGSTGWSTGCHLHFTVLRNGNPVDPMGYL